ncbi:hypothetical protein KKG81_04490 [bacterium]|nr:hypothetical protein [bacterium]
MYYTDEKDGAIILYGDSFDLKMDSKRLVYIKSKEESQFTKINDKPAVPIGFKRVEKQKALEQIYDAIENIDFNKNTKEVNKNGMES